MKIDATSSVYSVERYRAQTTKVSGKAAAAVPADQVHVSSEAMTFAESFSAAKAHIEAHLSQTNSVVETVRAQVANGTYSVDYDEVASSILLFT